MSELNTPVHISDAKFEEEVLKSTIPVLVDFWAPWCPPCLMVAPVLEELAKEHAGKIKVVKVNTDEHQNRAGELSIRGIPTLIIFKNGSEFERVVGAVSKKVLQQMVNRAIA